MRQREQSQRTEPEEAEDKGERGLVKVDQQVKKTRGEIKRHLKTKTNTKTKTEAETGTGTGTEIYQNSGTSCSLSVRFVCLPVYVD